MAKSNTNIKALTDAGSNIEDIDTIEVVAPTVTESPLRHSRVHCGNCFFRSKKMLTEANKVEIYLCHYAPPVMTAKTDSKSTNKIIFVPRMPTVRAKFDFCHGFVDVETLETLDAIVGINY